MSAAFHKKTVLCFVLPGMMGMSRRKASLKFQKTCIGHPFYHLSQMRVLITRQSTRARGTSRSMEDFLHQYLDQERLAPLDLVDFLKVNILIQMLLIR